MSIFAGRGAESIPAIKRFRLSAKAKRLSLTPQQLAYGTFVALAKDKPHQAAMYLAQAEAEGLTEAEKAAIETVLKDAEVI